MVMVIVIVEDFIRLSRIILLTWVESRLIHLFCFCLNYILFLFFSYLLVSIFLYPIDFFFGSLFYIKNIVFLRSYKKISMNIFPILLFLFVVDMLLYQNLLFIYFLFCCSFICALQTYSDQFNC